MKRLTKIGLGVTAGWVLATGIVSYCRIGDVSTMTLNEWGDFLAGVSAPLALFWLVIGYFQHGEELRLNTEVLKTQQEELRRQVEETARLVEATQDEVKYLQERERREARPDLIALGGPRRARYGITWKFQNRGAEVRSIRVLYEGSDVFTFSPQEVLESDSQGTLTLESEQRNHLPLPIQFCIVCTDLIGYSHTYTFELNEALLIKKLSHISEDSTAKQTE